MIWLRAEAASTSHSLSLPPLLPIPAPTSSPPLLLPSTNHREDRPEVTLPPRKRLGIALGPRYEVGESLSAAARLSGGCRADYGFIATLDAEIRRDPKRYVGYGITDYWDEMLEDIPEAPATDDTELGGSTSGSDYRVTSSGPQETCSDFRVAGGGPHETGVVHRGTETAEETSDPDDRLQAMIDQGVAAALAARDADRNTNDDDSHNSGTGVRRTERTAHECPYIDFLKCQPLNFKGTEGVAVYLNGLKEWSLFSTSVITVDHDAAYGMPWTDLIKKMTDTYNPRVEIKKLEAELMFLEESDKIERYIDGLPDMIYESKVASKPKTMQEVIEIATELMDKKICTFAERQTENKRKQDDNHQQLQQQQNKRQKTGRAYTAGSGEKNPYGESKPLCANATNTSWSMCSQIPLVQPSWHLARGL
ncbi:hypothetical protein Tco_0923140 [Tanacetum coccineum]|uniref:Retrotransposon gag domain-containing protein n=1 Tax=Tanacetum coccineum TaxID=301880 RepID=A0ABQ5D066_9ASTR